MNDLVIGIIRTVVPLGIGTGVSLLATLGVTGIDTAQAAAVATSVTVGVYYAVVAALERRYPSVGWLLGFKTAPTYQD